MKISVIGTGYVGLVSGTCLAEKGNSVTCIDIDQNKINKLKKGVITIYEPGLEPLFKRNTNENRLRFTTDYKQGLAGSGVIFLALPTPPDENGSADLSYVLRAAKDISKYLTEYTVIVNKSTVPVGTSKKIYEQVSKYTSVEFDVVANPEFLREGYAVQDFMKPDRIVIGGCSDRALAIMKELYEPFVRQGNTIIAMDALSAEMTKYAANSFLATKISFMNDIANLCERVGANVDNVRLGIGADERIGKRFLFPGIGYGGSCFPKDVRALIKTAAEYNRPLTILKAVEQINKKQKKILPKKVFKYFNGDIADKKFAIWGLSFKPDTDDMREAPSLDIIKRLVKLDAKIVAYDPEAMDFTRKLLTEEGINIDFAPDQYSALEKADALLIVTDWSEFQNPDFLKIKKLLKKPVIFDGRNLYQLDKMKNENFHYESIGRPVVN